MTDWELTNSNFTFEVVSSLFAIFGTFGKIKISKITTIKLGYLNKNF